MKVEIRDAKGRIWMFALNADPNGKSYWKALETRHRKSPQFIEDAPKREERPNTDWRDSDLVQSDPEYKSAVEAAAYAALALDNPWHVANDCGYVFTRKPLADCIIDN